MYELFEFFSRIRASLVSGIEPVQKEPISQVQMLFSHEAGNLRQTVVLKLSIEALPNGS